jgi:hypothetical protein
VPLADLALTCSALAGQLEALRARFAGVQGQFDCAGGWPALNELVAQARSTAASPLDIREVVGLGRMAARAVAFLEVLSLMASTLFPEQQIDAAHLGGEEPEGDPA